ncbi:MAG TPA: hypothetical protein VH062_36885 [Polyangiaceae bacterium]|jgi:hypothetical protein|nr:hypothetical protein [Polyangiaceae bacterium]
MSELVIRFFLGGAIVSVFALMGDRPRDGREADRQASLKYVHGGGS